MVGMLINVKKENATLVNYETLEDMQKLVDTDCITIVSRKIGNSFFDIVCDDEGLLKNEPIISAYNRNLEPELVGNLLITKYDFENENNVNLSVEDIKEINKNIIFSSVNKGISIILN